LKIKKKFGRKDKDLLNKIKIVSKLYKK
jgi:hypothetical protein